LCATDRNGSPLTHVLPAKAKEPKRENEKEKVRDTTKGSGQQPEIAQTEEPNPVGQDSPGNEYGEIGGAGSAPPRSMGTRGSEFGQFGDDDDRGQQGQSGTGQADLGTQAGSTLSGHADQQELGELGGEVDQPASYGGGIGGNQPNTQGEGFILQQGSGSDDLQQDEGPSSAKATEGTDFAGQGRGAPKDEDEASSEGGVG
jgi:hypothetical protein